MNLHKTYNMVSHNVIYFFIKTFGSWESTHTFASLFLNTFLKDKQKRNGKKERSEMRGLIRLYLVTEISPRDTKLSNAHLRLKEKKEIR